MSIAAEKDRIIVAADHQLVDKAFYVERIWRPARIQHVAIGSRAKWLDALTLIYEYDGCMYFPNGRPYRHAEIEDIFTDPSNRWMDEFLRAKPGGELPKSYSPKKERLRLIELYVRLVGASVVKSNSASVGAGSGSALRLAANHDWSNKSTVFNYYS